MLKVSLLLLTVTLYDYCVRYEVKWGLSLVWLQESWSFICKETPCFWGGLDCAGAINSWYANIGSKELCCQKFWSLFSGYGALLLIALLSWSALWLVKAVGIWAHWVDIDTATTSKWARDGELVALTDVDKIGKYHLTALLVEALMTTVWN